MHSRAHHRAALPGGARGARPPFFSTWTPPRRGCRRGTSRACTALRTSSRALERLYELVLADVADADVDLAVHHLDSPERAEALAARLRREVPGARDLLLSEVGAVVGAHAGPGLLAVVAAPAV